MAKSRSQQIAEKTMFAAFKILKEAGGEMRGKDVVDKVRETLTFDEYESHRFEKTGYIRNLYSISLQLQYIIAQLQLPNIHPYIYPHIHPCIYHLIIPCIITNGLASIT